MPFTFLILLLVAAPALGGPAVPASAQTFVDLAILKARAEALREAVADPAISDITIKECARGFFDRLPEETLVVPIDYRRMDRESVTGKLGTIEGMQKTADARVEWWERTHTEPPPADLEAAVAEARALKDDRRLSYDAEGKLAPNQLGIFRYMRDQFTGGVVKLNERLRVLAALVGEAFTYATVAHEAAHACDHAAGRLTPEKEVEGEMSAFRVQYQLIKLIDPSGERMLTLHAGLKLRMERETDPMLKDALRDAVTYLEHLSDVVATNGKEDELRKLIKRLGYENGHHENHDSKRDHDVGRTATAPESA